MKKLDDVVEVYKELYTRFSTVLGDVRKDRMKMTSSYGEEEDRKVEANLAASTVTASLFQGIFTEEDIYTEDESAEKKQVTCSQEPQKEIDRPNVLFESGGLLVKEDCGEVFVTRRGTGKVTLRIQDVCDERLLVTFSQDDVQCRPTEFNGPGFFFGP